MRNDGDDLILVDELGYFYRVAYEYVKYGGFPIDEIPAYIKASYEKCNGTLAGFPHLPTPAQLAKLILKKSWGYDSITMFSNPEHGTTVFEACMDVAFKAWEKVQNHERASTFGYGLLIGLGLAAVLVLFIGGFCYYYNRKEAQQKTPSKPQGSGYRRFGSLFEDSEREDSGQGVGMGTVRNEVTPINTRRVNTEKREEDRIPLEDYGSTPSSC